QARAHDGWRCDGDERAGQGLGVHRAPAGRRSHMNAMYLPRRRLLHLAFGAAALPAVSRIAQAQVYPTRTAGGAQDYPSRPVTMVVPFAAGGSTDAIARILAEGLRSELGQAVIVENVGGAGGMTGVNRVAKAAPDGYQFVLGNVGTHAVNQS